MLATDAIGDTTRDYAAHAAALHRKPAYRDRVYGHARRDGQGRLWLQYWLFYYYNDFQLLGPLLSGGKHEGDWELVQVRLGASEKPEQAVFSQHKTAESKAWANVRKRPSAATPLVYVARGSHANYFAPGSHWTGVWFDQADGKGPQIAPTLEVLEDSEPAGCCGPASGATRSRPARRWTPEPDQPRPPPALAGSVEAAPAPSPKQAPPAAAAPDDGAAHQGERRGRLRGPARGRDARRRLRRKGSDEPP